MNKLQIKRLLREVAAETSEWWDSLSEKERMDYLLKHPKSKYKGASAKAKIGKLSEDEKKILLEDMEGMVGPDSELSNKIAETFNDKDLSDEDVDEVATELKTAHRMRNNKKIKAAAKAGFKAALKMSAKVGMITIIGAGASAAGVPIGCFTPDLIAKVWEQLDFSENNNRSLVRNFCNAIKDRASEGFEPSEIEDSMTVTHNAQEV